jgi:hypothetical protein
MSDADLQLKTEEFMRNLGSGLQGIIDEYIPGMGFALLIFEFNKPGLSNYISNAQRENVIGALKEAAERLEKNQDIPAVITSLVH